MIKFSIDTKEWTINLSEALKIEPNIKVNQLLFINQAYNPSTGEVVNVGLRVIPDEVSI